MLIILSTAYRIRHSSEVIMKSADKLIIVLLFTVASHGVFANLKSNSLDSKFFTCKIDDDCQLVTRSGPVYAINKTSLAEYRKKFGDGPPTDDCKYYECGCGEAVCLKNICTARIKASMTAESYCKIPAAQ
jgi:ribosomal protein L36